MKKIIIIGATAGIGRSLAELYAQKGYEIGLTGRRINLLEEMKEQFPAAKIHTCPMDVAVVTNARQELLKLVDEMGGMDVCIINAGTGVLYANFAQQMTIVDINARGFLAVADAAYAYFAQHGGGHIVGISSVAALGGSRYTPAYNATKAFISTYMQGLRMRSLKQQDKIFITDIRPGFVDTALTKPNEKMFWVSTPEKAARQIFDAIETRKKVAYITKRWQLIAWLIKIVPSFIYEKLA